MAWAMLAYPGGRLVSWGERVALAIALAGAVLVLGLLPALFYDPATFGCLQCPDDLLLVSDAPGLVDDLNGVGVHLGLAWSLLLTAVAGWGVARSSRTRQRVVAPVVLAGCAYLGLVAATFATSLERGFVGSGELERRLWLGESAALAALGAAVAGTAANSPHTLSLARLVVELGESAPAGGLRDGLAEALADPDLEIAYPVGEGRYADARGRPVDLALSDGRAATPLVRDGRPVAVLKHRTGLLDNPELIEEVASAARLALENERLQAEARAQLEDLRSSRARIIETGDAERRRFERDLHDGRSSVSLACRWRCVSYKASSGRITSSSRASTRPRPSSCAQSPSCGSSPTASTRPASRTRKQAGMRDHLASSLRRVRGETWAASDSGLAPQALDSTLEHKVLDP